MGSAPIIPANKMSSVGKPGGEECPTICKQLQRQQGAAIRKMVSLGTTIFERFVQVPWLDQPKPFGTRRTNNGMKSDHNTFHPSTTQAGKHPTNQL